MKDHLGKQLSNLLRFHWRVYLRVKEKKAKAAAKKKAAANVKGKKGKKTSSTPLK